MAALFVGTAILFTCGFGRMSEYSSGERGYLRSATYYSDDWVINFWNSESVHMEEELARIAADGFNSIILAVPWREFQPETAPVMYEEYAWKKLGGVMDAAGKQGLGVILRVGYTWDYASPESALSISNFIGGTACFGIMLCTVWRELGKKEKSNAQET